MDASNKKRGRSKKIGPPASTPEGRENQLIGLAIDLAEVQLADGSASAQVQTHFLKLGTVRAKLELEKIKQENLLLAAKTEALESHKRVEKLYEKAIKAWRGYSGEPENEESDDR